jgi:hypothetical protein
MPSPSVMSWVCTSVSFTPSAAKPLGSVGPSARLVPKDRMRPTQCSATVLRRWLFAAGRGETHRRVPPGRTEGRRSQADQRVARRTRGGHARHGRLFPVASVEPAGRAPPVRRLVRGEYLHHLGHGLVNITAVIGRMTRSLPDLALSLSVPPNTGSSATTGHRPSRAITCVVHAQRQIRAWRVRCDLACLHATLPR